MKREENISDETDIKRANAAVRIELERTKHWEFRRLYMTGKVRSYT